MRRAVISRNDGGMDRFEPYGPDHLVLIGVFLLGCGAAAWWGSRLRGSPHETKVRRAYALSVLVFTLPLQVVLFTPTEFSRQTSYPLQLCDLSWMLAVGALWTRNERAGQLLYYWGIVLASQAVFTPDLAQPFPDPRYVMFWGMHFLTVWAAFFLTFGLGIRPSWAGFRFAVAVTLGWLVTVMTINALAGTNYGYLNRKPPVASLLDLFGPWPAYVVVEIVLVAGIWALMTWPWVRSSRETDAHAHA